MLSYNESKLLYPSIITYLLDQFSGLYPAAYLNPKLLPLPKSLAINRPLFLTFVGKWIHSVSQNVLEHADDWTTISNWVALLQTCVSHLKALGMTRNCFPNPSERYSKYLTILVFFVRSVRYWSWPPFFFQSISDPRAVSLGHISKAKVHQITILLTLLKPKQSY